MADLGGIQEPALWVGKELRRPRPRSANPRSVTGIASGGVSWTSVEVRAGLLADVARDAPRRSLRRTIAESAVGPNPQGASAC